MLAPSRTRKHLQHARPPGHDDHQSQLQHARNQHADAGGDACIGKHCHKRKAGDDRKVQQHRRKSRRRKASMRVHRARQQRDQRHAEQIGERDPRHQKRVLIGRRSWLKSGRQQAQKLAGEKQSQRQQNDLRAQQERENLRRELFGLLRARAFQRPRIGWHIGSVKRALAENSAEMIGQPEGNSESVRQRARTQSRAHHHVARKACCAREQSESAD